MLQLNIEMLERTVPKFNDFLKGEGDKWREERELKDKFFSKYFSKEQISNLEEATLRQLIYILWAFNGWTNKDYLFQEMLKSGIDKIKEAFSHLLYSEDSIADRFDFIRSNVRMMGAACISEILAHSEHSKFPIWNTRSKKGLVSLGIPESSLPKSAQISGAQYQAFCELVGKVRDDVSRLHAEFKDLFALDFLLYYISLEKIESPSTHIPGAAGADAILNEDFEHDAVIDQVLELGDGLGFEVQKEFYVTQGSRIDAIWRSRIANLGTLKYAFEIHRRGSRDSAVLNLQRVKRDPSIQKVIIVSTEAELEKFRGEISSLEESFRNSVGYFKVDDLQEALDHLGAMKDILKSLGLLSIEPFSL